MRNKRVIGLTILLLGLCWCFSWKNTMAGTGKTVDYLAEYESVRYDANSGLVSKEVNAVAQTPDGYIWIGTYSGLYRYDGVRFEKQELDSRICNVMVLFTDSKGNLWIGTNDSGLFCYGVDSGKILCYSTKNGMNSLSIRSICEDREGNIYVGTVANLSVIHTDGSVTTHSEWEKVTGIRSLATGKNGIVSGVTNAGILFFIRNEELEKDLYYRKSGIDYTAVCAGNAGEFFVGTSGKIVEKVRFDEKGFFRMDELKTKEIIYASALLFDEETEGLFLCCENGLGYIDEDGKLTSLVKDKFESSISGVIRDYQGDLWFVSNKQGIMKYAKNPFLNVFTRAGIKPEVVNSVMVLHDTLYAAMDNGLAMVDLKTYKRVKEKYLSHFDGVRIRHIMKDSQENIWISTYGQDGLIKVTPKGKVKIFNEEKKHTLGGRFRYCMELSNGVILAASNMGLTFIKNDKVVDTIGEADGLRAPQILTMVECSDGSILAGSDGDGVYRIKDGKLIEHIGEERGLETLVVLRIVPYEDNYLYVTSNALYYDNKKTVRKLSAFPYTNNYDIHITNDDAWISSSAGIFVVKVKDLIADKKYNYTLLDYSRGFTTSLTANAWNEATGDEKLFLCCIDGVRLVSTRSYCEIDNDFYIRVNSITSDEKAVKTDKNGTYLLPSNAKRIEISTAVLNFKLSNPLVHIFLEGAKDKGTTVLMGDLSTLSYTHLPYGHYTLHVQILDNITREVLRDETFKLYKEPKVMELLAVRIGIVAVGMLVVVLIVIKIMHATIIARQYEQIRLAKEEAERANSAKSRFLANMSHEIRTPINTIMGMDEMILREDKHGPMREYTASVGQYAIAIKRAAESLLGLVNDILDLSKIESGKMNLVINEYKTEELLRSIITMIRVRSNEKDLGFSVNIDPTLPKELSGDDGKIKQVLLNLLTNAVKYTEKGSFELSLKVEEKTEKNVRIRYQVSDTGIGIRPEDMEKLFSAFERLDEKRNSGIQGTGLGLDISRQFVELMGDELRCESVYGEGSTFYFTLFQEIVDEEEIGEFSEEADMSAQMSEYIPLFVAPDAKILVVDDNEMNLQVLKGLLRGTKVQIDTALSGQECLNKVKKENYHLLLLDHMMPQMDGLETLERLHEFNTTLPAIALTANAATNGEKFYKEHGFQGFLAKPVEGTKLEETMKDFLPKELLSAPEVEVDYEEKSELPDISWLYKCKGITVEEGIENCGGIREFYAAITTFFKTLEDKAKEIEDAFDREDYDFYTIKVHALKSSSRIIGAKVLSRLSEELENAGKRGDVAFIKENTHHLLEWYRSYLIILAPLKESDEEKELIPKQELADACEAMREFVEFMDYDSFEMVLGSLREYRFEAEDEALMQELEKGLRQLDWDGLKELLKDK